MLLNWKIQQRMCLWFTCLKTLLSSQFYMPGQRSTKRQDSHKYHRGFTAGGHFHSDDHIEGEAKVKNLRTSRRS